jgi:hypothetical protein
LHGPNLRRGSPSRQSGESRTGNYVAQDPRRD